MIFALFRPSVFQASHTQVEYDGPVPEPTEAQREAVETLVRKLLDAAEGQGLHVEAWERELLVYEVDRLMEYKIAIMEET